LAQLTSHLMHVRLVEIEFLGQVSIREVQAHAGQAQNPDPKRLMMTSKDRVASIVEVAVTGLAPVALTLGLGVITTLCGELRAVTGWPANGVWPAEGPDGLKAFGVVDA
jgi:hypothetical protein